MWKCPWAAAGIFLALAASPIYTSSAPAPLQKVFFYDSVDGDFLGQRVPDPVVFAMGKKRLLLEVSYLEEYLLILNIQI